VAKAKTAKAPEPDLWAEGRAELRRRLAAIGEEYTLEEAMAWSGEQAVAAARRVDDAERRTRVEAGRRPVAAAAVQPCPECCKEEGWHSVGCSRRNSPAAPALQVTHEPVYQIPRHWLRPLAHNGSPVNPRRHFDPVKLQELADSLREVGIQQALVVRMPDVIDGYRDPQRWTEELHPVLDIVAGERRFRAAELAGLEMVPCYIRPLTIEQAVDICIVENDQRSDLTAVERARGYRAWLDLVPGRTQEQLAKRIGVTQAQISNAIRLLQLPDVALQLGEDGLVAPTHMRDLFLQFARIPETVREAMFAEVAKAVRKEPGMAAGLEGLTEIVRKAAVRHSRPLAVGQMVYGAGVSDSDKLRPARDFTEAHAASCGCHAPAFAYQKWSNAFVRCFDLTWWEAAQAEAEQAREAEKAAAAAAAATAGAGAAQTVDGLTRTFGHGHVRIVASRKGVIYGHELLDPVVLEGTKLTIAKDWSGNPMLTSLDPKAVQRSKEAAEAVLQARLAERRAARTKADFEAIAARDELPLAEVVSLLTANLGYDGPKEAVNLLRKEFGFKKGEADARRLLQVMVLRRGRGDLTTSKYSDPLADKVKAELRADYEPMFRALYEQVAQPAPAVEPAAAEDLAPAPAPVAAAEPASAAGVRWDAVLPEEADLGKSLWFKAGCAAGRALCLACRGDIDARPSARAAHRKAHEKRGEFPRVPGKPVAKGRTGLAAKWPADQMRSAAARLALRILHVREADAMLHVAEEANEPHLEARWSRVLVRRYEALQPFCVREAVFPSAEDVEYLDGLADEFPQLISLSLLHGDDAEEEERVAAPPPAVVGEAPRVESAAFYDIVRQVIERSDARTRWAALRGRIVTAAEIAKQWVGEYSISSGYVSTDPPFCASSYFPTAISQEQVMGIWWGRGRMSIEERFEVPATYGPEAIIPVVRQLLDLRRTPEEEAQLTQAVAAAFLPTDDWRERWAALAQDGAEDNDLRQEILGCAVSRLKGAGAFVGESEGNPYVLRTDMWGVSFAFGDATTADRAPTLRTFDDGRDARIGGLVDAVRAAFGIYSPLEAAAFRSPTLPLDAPVPVATSTAEEGVAEDTPPRSSSRSKRAPARSGSSSSREVTR